MTYKAASILALQAKCDEFNFDCAVGDPVAVKLDGTDKPFITTTRSKAQLLGAHSAVVWLAGVTGCYSLDNVTPIPAGTAWAVYADNGNVIYWDRNFARVAEVAERYSRPVAPYTPIKENAPMSQTTLKVKIKRTHPDAKMPVRATPGSLCYDLYALDDGQPHPADDHAVHYRTGLAFECEPGWGFKIHSRSGHGFKSALRLSNSTGLIDCDYRNEVQVSIRFDASGTHRAKKLRAGDAIAQIEFVRQIDAEFEVVDELGTTERTGGFGSTGA